LNKDQVHDDNKLFLVQLDGVPARVLQVAQHLIQILFELDIKSVF
jgi:hypothetical protein